MTLESASAVDREPSNLSNLLIGAATVLALCVGSSESAAATEQWSTTESTTWTAATDDVEGWTWRDVQWAQQELKVAREILLSTEVAEAASFLDYVEVLDTALKAFELERDPRALALSLASARLTLEDDVESFVAWVGLQKATQPGATPAIPPRFIGESKSIPVMHPPDEQDLEDWIDLGAEHA